MSTTTTLFHAIRLQHGFLTDEQVASLAGRHSTRLTQVLVRCGGSRFTCSAQDAARLIAAVEASGDYVRDVSLPAGSPLWHRINQGDLEGPFRFPNGRANIWYDRTEGAYYDRSTDIYLSSEEALLLQRV